VTPRPSSDVGPYIVTLSVPVAIFRESLANDIPDARLGRELPRHQVVVILPGTLVDSLSALPGVDSVMPDPLLKTLRP